MPKHAAIRKPKPLFTPHDRRQAINRAPSPQWVANFRELIRCNDLINRLQTFALADPDNPAPGDIRMTRTQAMVALSMLRKVLPDMQALEIKGSSEQPITVQIVRFSDAPVPEPLTIDAKPLQTIETVLDAMPNLIEDEPKPKKPRGAAAHKYRLATYARDNKG